MTTAATGGAWVAQLRKARGITQVALARRAGISLSLLSKIEVGDRALSPGVAAAIARALQVPLGALYGEAEISVDQGVQLGQLRTALRRYDMPDQAPGPEQAQLRVELNQAIALREQADLASLLRVLPGLLTRATTYAHAAVSPQGWALLADVYSVVYYLVGRYRWMDLVEVTPTRQAWAAAQQPNPLVTALAARSRANTFLYNGDFDGGLTVVDRAIVAAEAALTGREKAFAAGTLHLRGLVLVGRLNDRIEAENDLGRPREVIRLADELSSKETGLPPTRLFDVHTSFARAQLDLGDRDGALTSLMQAFDVAPQKAKVNAMSREVLQVLISLHRRSNPQLVKLAKQAGLTG